MKARQKSKNRYMNIDLSEPHSEFHIRKAAVSNRWTGLLEWTTGMDYRNGL